MFAMKIILMEPAKFLRWLNHKASYVELKKVAEKNVSNFLCNN